MRDEAEAIRNLYWPEEDGRATGGRMEAPSDRPRTGRELGDAFRYSRASLRESLGLPGFVATRGPISFNQEETDDPGPQPGEESVQSQWSNPSHDIVRDLEDYAPEGRAVARREGEESVTASPRPGISIDHFDGRPVPVQDVGPYGIRLRGTILTCEEHREDAKDYDGCPVCNEEGEEARVRREEYATLENQQLVRAANNLLQVWSDLDTSSAPIPRHFRIRMESAARNLRAARP